MRWMAVIVFLLSLTGPSALAAKEPNEQSWENLKELKVGHEIQVVQINVKSLKGTFLGVSEEAISLRVKKNEVAIPRADVFRVTSRERSRRVRNALIGTAIGLGVGIGVGLWALVATGGSDDPGVIIYPAMAIGGGLGGGAGAALASHPTIYRAKKMRRR